MNIDNSIFGDLRGCALVLRGNETPLSYEGGYSDLANSIPNRRNTRFATASAGKVFIAVAILQLIEQGKLALDTRIADVPGLELGKIDPDITIEQLLSHTSGMADYFDESVMDDYEELWYDFPNYRIRSNSDLLPLFINKPAAFPRGERFEYNNSGFVMLALVIEKLTGLVFDEYLKKHIFEPCNIERTGYFELDMLPEGCAANYILDEERGGYRTNIYSVDAKGTGAGGAFTTVDDIVKFWRCLYAGSLISRESMLNMFRDHSGEGEYGLGVWLRKGRTPYIQGEDPGVSFVSLFDPETDLISVVVSNYGDDVWQIQHDILEALEN